MTIEHHLQVIDRDVASKYLPNNLLIYLILHTINVASGTTVYMETEADAPGQWAFHCHLSYHAAAGMFRVVVVEGGPQTALYEDKR